MSPAPSRVTVAALATLAMLAITTAGCSAGADSVAPSALSAPSATASSRVTLVPALVGRSAATPAVPRRVGKEHLARSVPIRIRISSIGVDSGLMDLGLRGDGTMEVPPAGFPAGWYTDAPTPGELGPAIIAGHVDWKGPGVFYRLHSLRPGDKIIVTRQDGSSPVFRVTQVAQFRKDHFPTSLVYGDIDHAGLRLITCGGSFNSASGHYVDNIVAFADLDTSGR